MEAGIIIFLHENIRNLRIHVKNHLSSPSLAYSSNLKRANYDFDENDSGFILEHMLSDNYINISNFYKIELVSKLLDIKLYLQNVFQGLK